LWAEKLSKKKRSEISRSPSTVEKKFALDTKIGQIGQIGLVYLFLDGIKLRFLDKVSGHFIPSGYDSDVEAS
jgi:hypothetical protein